MTYDIYVQYTKSQYKWSCHTVEIWIEDRVRPLFDPEWQRKDDWMISWWYQLVLNFYHPRKRFQLHQVEVRILSLYDCCLSYHFSHLCKAIKKVVQLYDIYIHIHIYVDIMIYMILRILTPQKWLFWGPGPPIQVQTQYVPFFIPTQSPPNRRSHWRLSRNPKMRVELLWGPFWRTMDEDWNLHNSYHCK